MITSVDELQYKGGYPTAGTIRKLYDQLDLQRAAQAYLDFIPAMSMQAVLDAHPRDYGVSETGGMIVYVEPGEGKSIADRPDLQHREHLRQPQPRPEADRPGRHRGAAEGPGRHQRRLHALRGGPGQCRPRPRPGRQVPPPAAGLPGRRAGRLLRLPVEHLPQLGDGARLRADHRPRARPRWRTTRSISRSIRWARARISPASSVRPSRKATRPIRATFATSSGCTRWSSYEPLSAFTAGGTGPASFAWGS